MKKQGQSLGCRAVHWVPWRSGPCHAFHGGEEVGVRRGVASRYGSRDQYVDEVPSLAGCSVGGLGNGERQRTSEGWVDGGCKPSNKPIESSRRDAGLNEVDEHLDALINATFSIREQVLYLVSNARIVHRSSLCECDALAHLDIAPGVGVF